MRSSGMPSSGKETCMPDNARYYHLAYVVAVVIYALYALTILRRRKALGDPK